tara:strand:- start:489 stop:2288 length:1800 start_codon:yes stop_codon:yes gene_type:complete
MFPDSIDIDPFENWDQEPLSVEIVMGYIYNVPGMYSYLTDRDNRVTNPITGKEVSLLDAFIATITDESGRKQYIKSMGSEQSYGIIQLRQGQIDPNDNSKFKQVVHAQAIANEAARLNPQYNAQDFMVPITQMNEDVYAAFLRTVTDMNFQMTQAFDLIQRNGLTDWSSYNNERWLNHIDDVSNEISLIQNSGHGWITRLQDSASQHSVDQGSRVFDTSTLSSYTGVPTTKTTMLPEGEGTGPGGTPTSTYINYSDAEKWKIVKKEWLGDLYNQETDTLLPGAENTPEYSDWVSTFGYVEDFDEFDPENPLDELLDDERANFLSSYRTAFGESAYFNPFDQRNLRGAPSYADSIMLAVYERYLASASYGQSSIGELYQGGASYAQAKALGYLGTPSSIKRMLSIIELNKNSGLDPQGMVDLVAEGMSSFSIGQTQYKWGFELPEFDDAGQITNIETMNAKIMNIMRPWLIEDHQLADTIRRDWTSFRILNPNTTMSLEDFAGERIRRSKEYKQIFGKKPNAFTEAQYLSQFGSAILQGGAQGKNYDKHLKAAARLGSSPQGAYTAAQFGSGPGAMLSDSFNKKVSDISDAVGGMIGEEL